MKIRLVSLFATVLGVALGVTTPSLASEALTTVMTAVSPQPAGAESAVDVLWLNHSPTAQHFVPPGTIRGILRQNQREWPVELRAQGLSDPREPIILSGAFGSVTYVFTSPHDAQGALALQIEQPFTASAMVEILPTGPADDPGFGAASPTSSLIAPDRPALAHLQRAFANHFGFHEPIYFLYGSDDPVGKFQFSLRYRLVGRTRGPDVMEPPVRGLYFGYTQRSLWDLDGDSSPFYDTSYMPEVMFESLAPERPDARGWFHWLGFQAGAKHESNGKDGADSRSLNIAYVRPAVAFGALDGWHLVVAPRVFAYLGTSTDNEDIEDYRGYGELMLVFGRSDGLLINATGMIGKEWDKGSIQVDISHPIRIPRVEFDTYLHVQYFNGYGESLRAYNEKSSTWRAGFSIVR